MAASSVNYYIIGAVMLMLALRGESINCYVRTWSTSNSNGSQCSGASKCYSYSDYLGNTASCGECPNRPNIVCSLCTSELCNVQPVTRCKVSSYSYWYENRESTICYGHSQCHEDKTTTLFANIFTAGCGPCSFVASDQCRTCDTPNCNAGSKIGTSGLVSVLLALFIAAASAISH